MMQQIRDQFWYAVSSIVQGRVSIGTYLKTADKVIRDVVLEERFASVVFTTPAPDVLAITIDFALIQDRSTNTPHNDAEDKEPNCECGVVDCDLFRSSMTASPVSVEDDHTHEE